MLRFVPFPAFLGFFLGACLLQHLWREKTEITLKSIVVSVSLNMACASVLLLLMHFNPPIQKSFFLLYLLGLLGAVARLFYGAYCSQCLKDSFIPRDRFMIDGGQPETKYFYLSMVVLSVSVLLPLMAYIILFFLRMWAAGRMA